MNDRGGIQKYHSRNEKLTIYTDEEDSLQQADIPLKIKCILIKKMISMICKLKKWGHAKDEIESYIKDAVELEDEEDADVDTKEDDEPSQSARPRS